MEYTGPATLSDPHMDLTIHEENFQDEEHWPLLSSPPIIDAHDVDSEAVASTSKVDIIRSGARPKRNLEEGSNSGIQAFSSAAKTSKPNPTSSPTSTPTSTRKQPPSQHRAVDSTRALTPPAFAPRADYMKLAFRENPSVETKIRWLADVNRTLNSPRS